MSLDALDALEAKIQQAADRIGELAEQKSDLEHRITELEAELATARSASRSESATEREAEWAEEKAELKRRIEKLVARLEELLEPEQ
jgi:FtsZ-binding cell division protein ZapB